jgi:hypothetical protein
MKMRRLKINPLSEREKALRFWRVASPIVDEMITEYINTLNDNGEYDLAHSLDQGWRYGEGVVREEGQLQTIKDVSISLKSALSPLLNTVWSAPSHLQFDVLAEFQERLRNVRMQAFGPSIPSRMEVGQIEEYAYRGRKADYEYEEYAQEGRRIEKGERITRAAKMLGYKRVGERSHFGEETDWQCLAPEPDRDEKCRSAWGSEDGRDALYAKDPNWWVDFGRYPDPDPEEDLYPWLLLAKKHDFRSLPDYFSPKSRDVVEKWLRSRKPSRKALERKLPRFFATLPSEYDFSDRAVPDFVRQAGGRHVENEVELRVVGRQNGWCFGSTHYANHLTEIEEYGSHLYFIPHPRGTIALYGRFNESWDDGDDDDLVIPTEIGIFQMEEAKFPGNEEAIPTVLRIAYGYQARLLEEERRREQEEAELEALAESGRRPSKRYKGRRSQTRQRLRAAPRQRRNPTDLKGRHIPEKYLSGLSARERKQRIAELTEQRDRKGKGDKRYAELETDRLARKKGLVKQSAYSQVAEKRGIQIRYKGAQPDFKATARAALRYYKAKGDVNEIAALLEQSYDKGLAAWQSGGHRPGASQRNWGDARVHSLLVGGKTAWYPSADRKQVRQFPRKMKEGIIRQMPEVFKALRAQGRQKDINYLRPKHNAAMKLI